MLQYVDRYGDAIYDRLFASCELFTANSNFTANRLRQLGCPDEKIVILPMGIDLQRFAFVHRIRNPAEPLRLLTVARLEPMKHLHIAIQAVAEACRQGVMLTYEIIGEGSLRGELHQMARTLGAEAAIHFRGAKPADQVSQAMSAADVFVLTSSLETQGVVLAEAQATGLPVLVADAAGAPESLVDGQSGWLHPLGDIATLAGQIRWCAEHRNQLIVMGKAGRAFVERKFDQDVLNDRLLALYQTISHAGPF